MDLETLLSFEWSMMTPEFIILGLAAASDVTGFIHAKRKDRKILGWISVAGILAAIVSLGGLMDQEVTSILYDTFRLDAFAKAFKLMLTSRCGHGHFAGDEL